MVAVVACVGCRRELPKAPEKVVNVAVEPLQPRPMADVLMVRAKAEPWQSVRLSSEVSGRLVLIAKEEGQRVSRGERLFALDKASFEALLHAAQAKAEYEALNYQRNRALLERKAASQDEVDKVLSEKLMAEAALENAAAQLAKTDIFSPLDGVLDAKLAEVGETVGPGTPLADLVDVSRVKVIAPVPEKDVVFVKVGDRLKVIIDALGFAELEGQVIFVKQVADAGTLTFPVHMAVDNRAGLIRPGMIARVALVRRRFDQALAVPLFALIRSASGSVVSGPQAMCYHVFVEEGGAARRRDVQVGILEGAFIQVTAGLKPGDRLIVGGQRDLTDGDRVRVVPAGASAGFVAGGPQAGPGSGPAASAQSAPAAGTNEVPAVPAGGVSGGQGAGANRIGSK